MTATNVHTVIVGAGIIGAAIAYNLAKNGDRPIILDKNSPANGITGSSFGWLNAYNTENREYFDFRYRSMDEYKTLVKELTTGFDVHWNGSLVWHHENIVSNSLVERLQAWGYDIEIIEESRIRQLEPSLAEPPSYACYAAGEGSVDPVSVTNALIDAAVEKGVRLRTDCHVSGLRINNSRITAVETGDDIIKCNAVIVAAGHGSGIICRAAGLNIPVRTSEALLVKTQRVDPVVNGLLSAPGIRLWQARDGSMLACDDFDSTNLVARADELAGELMDRANQLVKIFEPLSAMKVMIGQRLLPGDGMPVIGESAAVGGFYLALMHSGITLAPLAGRLVAGEIVSGREDPLLKPYRPDRLLPAA